MQFRLASLALLATSLLASAAPIPLSKCDMSRCNVNNIDTPGYFDIGELEEITKAYFPLNDTDNARAINSTGYIPDSLKIEMTPQSIVDGFADLGSVAATSVTSLAGMPSAYQINNMKSYPYHFVGQLLRDAYDGDPGGLCTGTLVGPRLLLTAAHCMPSFVSSRSTMTFTPAYNGASGKKAPYGHARIETWKGVKSIGYDFGTDFVIAKLDKPLGSSLGHMGYKAWTDDSDYFDREFSSVGYPEEFNSNADVPYLQSHIKFSEVLDSKYDGKELESPNFASPGWSGGPVFNFVGGEAKVVGVVSRLESGGKKKHLSSDGGLAMARLIEWGLRNWPS